MLNTSFQYSNAETKAVKALNHALGTPAWKVWGATAISLTPSLLLVFLTGNLFVITCGLVCVGILIVAMIWAMMKAQVNDLQKTELVLLEDFIRQTTDHTVTETSWSCFQSYKEQSIGFFLVNEVGNHFLIPSRAIPNEQMETFRSLLQKVGTEIPPVDHVILPLYQELKNLPASELTEFEYHKSDLENMAADWKVLNQESQPNRRSNHGLVMVLLLSLAVGFSMLLFDMPRPIFRANRLDTYQLLLVVAAFILPFIMLTIVLKISKRFRSTKEHRIPKEKSMFALRADGWLVGNHLSMTFHDWRDIVDLYESSTCYGFKTKQNLLVFLPKRIFANESAQQDFINQASELHRRSQSQNAQVSAVESDNPYQTPTH